MNSSTDAGQRRLLLVESRRATFNESLLARPDVTTVLLRLGDSSTRSHGSGPDGQDAENSRHMFVLDSSRSIDQEAARYREWVGHIGVVPEYFCNPNEAVQPQAQAFAAAVGLPHLTQEQVLLVHEKPAMKKLYHRIGLRSAAYGLVDGVQEIERFAAVHGWPLILKPVDSDSCIGTWKLREADLPHAERLLRDGHRWMVEEYIKGHEHQLCALVADGRVLDAYVSSNPAPILDVLDGAINANITLAPSEPKPIDAVELCQHLVDGVEYGSGYLHAEFWMTDAGEFVMGELAARLSGCEVPLNHGLSYGFDIMQAITDLYVGRTPVLEYTRDRSVGDLLLPTAPGVVTEITPAEELLAQEGVISCRMRAAVGDLVDPPRASFACSGVVQVTGQDSAEVTDRMRKILSGYRFTTETPDTARETR
ncbi:ATP-dependent carboxylate-amine ligase [Streptomyces sp. NPDC056161]|uniref:ATP-grasp domain-containing protein n=1 Tax=Streptomyces sp. NPDC056161 TaxID=3345732 RepID=UPI0035E0B06A